MKYTRLTLWTKHEQVQWDVFLNQEILWDKHGMSWKYHQLKPKINIEESIRWFNDIEVGKNDCNLSATNRQDFDVWTILDDLLAPPKS
jgi:hypothetical protein